MEVQEASATATTSGHVGCAKLKGWKATANLAAANRRDNVAKQATLLLTRLRLPQTLAPCPVSCALPSWQLLPTQEHSRACEAQA
eukprot:3449034-Pleurochrysis_carterae.AAC.1